MAATPHCPFLSSLARTLFPLDTALTRILFPSVSCTGETPGARRSAARGRGSAAARRGRCTPSQQATLDQKLSPRRRRRSASSPPSLDPPGTPIGHPRHRRSSGDATFRSSMIAGSLSRLIFDQRPRTASVRRERERETDGRAPLVRFSIISCARCATAM